MTVTGGPEPFPIAQQFLDLVTRYSEGITLTPDAQWIAASLLQNASAAIAAVPDEYRRYALQDATSKLYQALSAIRSDLDRYQVMEVNEPLLTELLRAQCPVPPFCYGDANDPLRATTPSDVTAWIERVRDSVVQVSSV
jgi:hypothetical protein